MNLDDAVDNVTDQQSFYIFVEALIREWEQDGERWENRTLGSFLEAALAWARDSRLDPVPNWRAFAEFLVAGTLYE